MIINKIKACLISLSFFAKSKAPFHSVLLWQALIQCEQLKNELERQTDRLEKELASQQEKRAFEKETMRKEITKEREDMGSKVLGDSICYLLQQKCDVTEDCRLSFLNEHSGLNTL